MIIIGETNDRLKALEKKLAETSDGLSRKTVEFLLGPEALAPYSAKIDTLQAGIEALAKVADSGALGEELDTMGTGLDLLAEIINNLKIDGQELLLKGNTATQRYIEDYEREKVRGTKRGRAAGALRWPSRRGTPWPRPCCRRRW